jgi:hypothetical protein
VSVPLNRHRQRGRCSRTEIVTVVMRFFITATSKSGASDPRGRLPEF